MKTRIIPGTLVWWSHDHKHAGLVIAYCPGRWARARDYVIILEQGRLLKRAPLRALV